MARLEPTHWDFAATRRAEIDAHWAKLVADKPKMFNGQVLLQHRWTLKDGVYDCAYQQVDYASFVAWIQLGQPGAPRRNGFAMAALETTDGAFLLGQMGSHTVNAGKIYFPAGTPDLDDVTANNEVDLAGSLTRELYEETGLKPHEVIIEDSWTLVAENYRAAFMKRAVIQQDAKTAREMILSRLASETDQELSDMIIVRNPSEIDDVRTPLFAAAYMRHVFKLRRMMTLTSSAPVCGAQGHPRPDQAPG
jgi:8-oxo-dGTP pyrophosphatase MutT (NUDIX family)